MSLKLYYGHKYNGTYEELLADLRRLRDEYRDSVRTMYTTVINGLKESNKKCTYEYSYCDKQRGMYYKDFTPFDWATFLEGNIRGGLKGPLNVGSSVVIYPCKGDIYVLPFIGTGYDDLAKVSDKFQEYGYWDNSDKPEGISDNEWDERARVWNSIVKYGEPYSTYGFSYDLYTEADVLLTVLNLDINRGKPEEAPSQE